MRLALPVAFAFLAASSWAASTTSIISSALASHSAPGHIIFQSFTRTATASIATSASGSATATGSTTSNEQQQQQQQQEEDDEDNFPTRSASNDTAAATNTVAALGDKEPRQRAECMASGVEDWDRGLQISGVFIILGVSALGAMLPVACKHVSWLNVSPWLLTLGKFFGAGVILATAFVHMLGGATETLKDDCLDGRMGDFDNWPGLLAMFAVLAMHLIEHVLTATYLGNSNANVSDRDLEQMPSHNAMTLAEPRHSNDEEEDEEEKRDVTPANKTLMIPSHVHGFIDMDRRRKHLST
ncbi:hypothetical protein GGI21_006036, partial [Coemansia aciculifera]